LLTVRSAGIAWPTSRPSGDKRKANPILKQAAVIGAGIGGLAAAKAVAPHFEKVIVFDRDALPDAPTPRPGTPQARHTHGLLAGGCRALECLFPGIEFDLVKAGAVRYRVRRDMRVEVPGFDPLPQRDFGFDQFGLSRPVLEVVCRRRVEREPNIEFRPRARVTELTASLDNGSVAGVRFEDTRGRPRSLAADLVVDASGRASPTLHFLEAIDSAKPAAIEIGIDQPMRRPYSTYPRTLRRIGASWCTRPPRRTAADWGSFSRWRGDDGAFRFA
jgi:2-polyprenyl-6-methoxyphenol hydroxylase-like FAD-dependent oxidoreductase